MRVQVISLSAVTLAVGIVLADDPKATPPRTAAPSFDATVTPLFNKSCVACHNDRLASGGLNLGPFTNPASLMSHREEWERILQKIRTGEMPPKGMPRPPAAQTDALMKFVHEKWEAADRNIAPDPGRVTARRLNRNEYSNTIRDLLGVDFRAERDFPDRRFRLRLRQHRRRPDDFACVDGEVHLGGRAHRCPRDRRRPASEETARSRILTTKDKRPRSTCQHRGQPPHRVRLGCRVRDSHRAARRARRRRQARHAWASGWTAS